MILSNGTNQYPNNEFSFWEWSAPILQKPEEVLQKLQELRLEGRVVKDMIAIGMGYGWTTDNILEMTYSPDQESFLMENLFSDAERLLSSDFQFQCTASTDQPLLLVFEDGDVLGISFDEGSSVRMELNTIPIDIQPGINYKNFHANRLFRDLIGKTISEAWATATSKEPEFTWSHGLDLEEQSFYIDSVVLKFQDQEKVWKHPSLRFRAWFDYGEIELLNEEFEIATISAEQVQQLVEGYSASEFFQNVSEKKVTALKWIYKHFGRKRNG